MVEEEEAGTDSVSPGGQAKSVPASSSLAVAAGLSTALQLRRRRTALTQCGWATGPAKRKVSCMAVEGGRQAPGRVNGQACLAPPSPLAPP